MFWQVLSKTIHSIFAIGGIVMGIIGAYFDIIQASQTPKGPFGFSILVWGMILFTITSVSIIAQLWWHIRRIETPLKVIEKELKREKISADRYSMLEIFDVLREYFALGLTYSQIHGVLVDKLDRDEAWGIYSSDILAMFTQLGLIHSPTIDPSHLAFIDNQRSIPDYVYKLTDKGNLLAHKIRNQKLNQNKEDSRN